MACLTDEDKNFIRLQMLVTKIATKAIRELLETNSTLKPTELDRTPQKKKKHVQTLNNGGIITPVQMSLLYPTVGTDKATTFDITLMVALLRNYGNLGIPRTFKWNVLPPFIDLTTHADVARLKYYRNILAHTSSGICDVDFNNYWKDISAAIFRLGSSPLHGQYKKEIDQLELFPFTQDDVFQTLQDIRTDLQTNFTNLQEQKDNVFNYIDILTQTLKEGFKEIKEQVPQNKKEIENHIDKNTKECMYTTFY